MSQQNQKLFNQETNVAMDVANQLGDQKPPTNEQISTIIDKTQQFLEEKKNEPAVSKQSMKVLSDFQGVLEATEQFNKNKNPDEALQKVVIETGAAGKELKEAGQEALNKQQGYSLQQQGSLLQQKGQQAQEQGKQLTQAIWSVLKEMVQSSDFRLQLASLLNVFQDLLYRGTPSSSAQQDSALQEMQDQQQVDLQKLSSSQGYDYARQEMETSQHQDLVRHESQSSLQQVVKQKTGLSEENKREIAHQFLLVLRKLNQNPDFRTGLQQLIGLFQSLGNEQTYSTTPFTTDSSPIAGQQDISKISNEVQQVIQKSDHVDAACEESKKLVERFSKRPVDLLIEKNRSLFEYVRNHQEARQWWDNLTNFLKEVLEKPDQLDEFECSKKAEDLINEGDAIANDSELNLRYRRVQDELRTIFDAIREDPDLKLLQEKTQQFLDNFTTVGSDGQRKLNTDLMKDLQSFVVPLMIAQLDRIPLPPVSGSNEDYDYHFDNMVLYGQDILPESVKVHAQSDAEFNVRQLEAKEAKTQIYLEISNIQAKVENIHFNISKKTFPVITDEGVANLRVEGNEGFSLKLSLSVDTNAQGMPRFNLKKVDANIQSLKIDIVEATHPLLLKFFALFYQTKMKFMVQDSLEEKIREVFEKIEQGMNTVFARFPSSNLKEAITQKADEALGNTNQQQSKQQSTNQQQDIKTFLA